MPIMVSRFSYIGYFFCWTPKDKHLHSLLMNKVLQMIQDLWMKRRHNHGFWYNRSYFRIQFWSVSHFLSVCRNQPPGEGFSFCHVDSKYGAQPARPMPQTPSLTELSYWPLKDLFKWGVGTGRVENKIRWTIHILEIVMKQLKHRPCLFFGAVDWLLLLKFLTSRRLSLPCVRVNSWERCLGFDGNSRFVVTVSWVGRCWQMKKWAPPLVTLWMDCEGLINFLFTGADPHPSLLCRKAAWFAYWGEWLRGGLFGKQDNKVH